MTFEIKLEAFEGPLDLLLHLINKNKVDIYDIPIVTITDQYIQYIDAMRVRDMDIMSEFLLMAATLLSIKSKMLLPSLREGDEPEEDPRQELVERLAEYKAYKEIALQLKDMQVDAAHQVFRKKDLPKEVACYQEPVDTKKLLDGLTLNRLNCIFKEVLKRKELRKDAVRSDFGTIKKEKISLEECIESVMEYANHHGRFSFGALFNEARTKMEIIVTFLALLELMKAGKLFIAQESLFDDIIIEKRAAA